MQRQYCGEAACRTNTELIETLMEISIVAGRLAQNMKRLSKHGKSEGGKENGKNDGTRCSAY